MKSRINTSFNDTSEKIVYLYDKVASRVAEIYEGQNHIRWIQRFTEELPRGGKILDLGCGSGKDVAIVNSLGFEAIGVDGSKGMLHEATKRHPGIRVMLGDIGNLELSNKFFDGVWSWSVTTHLKIEDKKKTLKEVLRVLKSGGIFAQTIWRGEGLFVYKFHKNIPPRPHYLISISSWRKLYREVGFVNFNVEYIEVKKGRGSVHLTAIKK
ncbi:MAG: hypothetical protein A2Z42_03400 [Candidatus Woykebacteria bacterium RBG_19FT_COMBO_43_10]|uniref:Methyltransferase domain-containing protein n=1 Tax=Candidatus Woykebacteria bacterium RBG_19FT_COMBO_43_10 TaxID=1802598 RepID=A0A1G1WF70_9BACT|nr:MAG: hypothetical protein A2Z42_03400 [Candidatus Woykebacteria bacterium RBG_19FT_COMBO_43_10]